jgi:hypothetical protein
MIATTPSPENDRIHTGTANGRYNASPVKRSSSQINASALLVGLITLVSLGSVATASVGAAMISPERCAMAREEREGESVARLILSLTDAAKRLHGQTHAVSTRPQVGVCPLALAEHCDAPAPPCLPNAQVLGSARLIDLPPPTR